MEDLGEQIGSGPKKDWEHAKEIIFKNTGPILSASNKVLQLCRA